MAPDPSTELESSDAEKVNTAIQAMNAGKLDEAESILLAVIANTPADYSNSKENDDSISIKFWDQTEFIHYVTWQKEKGFAISDIKWIFNAYPRAHYYMGFLCVKQKQFDRAMEYLDKGHSLEPTNPKFLFEKAQALVHSGRKQESLELYEKVTEINAYVSAHDLAVARRGRGFVLIELGDLDAAEIAFRSSLEIEQDNKVALNELRYIEHLRNDGSASSTEAVASTGPDLSNCAVCGQQFDQGVVVSFKGMPMSICNRCKGRLTKKWWQFWK